MKTLLHGFVTAEGEFVCLSVDFTLGGCLAGDPGKCIVGC